MHKEVKRKELWHLDRKEKLPDITKEVVVSPPHYGDTLEICLVRGIEGETFINGKKYVFEPTNVFLIPPQHLHTSIYRKGGLGEDHMVCAFHINIEELAAYVDIKRILLSDNRTLLMFPTRYHDFERIWELIQSILDDKRTFIARIGNLIELFEIFSRQSPCDAETAEYNRSAIEIINWVEAHYADKVSIQDIADHFGYNKYYFCKWFKANTGITYNEFLTAVRINHACTYLLNGHSVDDTA